MTVPAFDPYGTARLSVTEVMRDFGAAALDDEAKMSSLLPDLLADAPREATLVRMAAATKVGGMLSERISRQGIPVTAAIEDVAQRMSAANVLDLNGCRWVVGEYAIALGFLVPIGMPPPGGGAPAGAGRATVPPPSPAVPTSPGLPPLASPQPVPPPIVTGPPSPSTAPAAGAPPPAPATPGAVSPAPGTAGAATPGVPTPRGVAKPPGGVASPDVVRSPGLPAGTPASPAVPPVAPTSVDPVPTSDVVTSPGTVPFPGAVLSPPASSPGGVISPPVPVPVSPGGFPGEHTRADTSLGAGPGGGLGPGPGGGLSPAPGIGQAPPASTPAGTPTGTTTEPVRPRFVGAGVLAAIFPVALAGAILLVFHGVWHGTETDPVFAGLMWLIFLAPLTAATWLTGLTHKGGRRSRVALVLYLLVPLVLTVALPIFFLKSWDRDDHDVKLFATDVSSEWAVAFAISVGLLAHAWMKRQGIVSRVTPVSLAVPAIAFVLFLKWRPVTLLGGANAVALEQTSQTGLWRTLTVCAILVPVAVVVTGLIARALRERLDARS